MNNCISLDGKHALVTGGSRGLGLAICCLLGSSGATVWVNDIVGDSAEAAVADLRRKGVSAYSIPFDVTRRTAVANAETELRKECSGIDVLINNAGIGDFVSWPEIGDEKWHRMIDVHLTGAFNCSSTFLPAMIRSGWGRVINISSVAGKRGDHMGNTHYTAAKAGLIGLTKSLAANVAKSGVTVNAVAPGLVDTELSRQMSQELKQETLNRIPIGRLGAPEEIAAVVLFLASNWASYIVGETISVNGGSYMD